MNKNSFKNFFIFSLLLFSIFSFLNLVFAEGENTPPVADANGPYQGIIDEEIDIDGSASFDSDGDSLSYSWDFGDGNTGTGISPKHTYSKRGEYTITLIANDGTENSLPSKTIVGIAETNLRGPALSSPTNATIAGFPVSLDWEDVPTAKSYILKIYVSDGNSFVAHRYIGNSVWQISNTEYLDQFAEGGLCFFSDKNTTYAWKVAACIDEKFKTCGFYSESWEFTTENIIPSIEITSPMENQIVNFSDKIEWISSRNEDCILPPSYNYIITGKNNEELFNSYARSTSASFNKALEEIWKIDDFNEEYPSDFEYSLLARTCQDDKGENCEGSFSTSRLFKISKAIPINLKVSDALPTELSWDPIWDPILEALSYRYIIFYIEENSDILVSEGTIKENKISIESSKLIPDEDYYWKISSCADKNGEFCGKWSGTQNLTIKSLKVPEDPKPGIGGELLTVQKYLSWKEVSGAEAYKVSIDIPDGNQLEGFPKIVYSNSIFVSLKKLGTYNWYVRACLNRSCNEKIEKYSAWSFKLIESKYRRSEITAPLLPCGQNEDDPRTSWNERDDCELKHLFFLVKNILDFLLWRAGLIILSLLSLTIGAMYYFNFGSGEMLQKTKSILKSAMQGWGIIFFAWFFVSMFLRLLGYTFDSWWILPF